mmetsp:Transcript_677/g.1773  ORF Transcript_677/g.1773 Transcript_677/m.1773 type:complete len:118 (+) Transcript_677:75-428(+)
MRNTAKQIAQTVGRAFAKMNYAPAAVPAGRRPYKHTKATKPWNTRCEGAHLKAERVALSLDGAGTVGQAANAGKKAAFVPVVVEEEPPTLMDHFNALEDALLGTLLPQAPRPELQGA